MRIVKLSAAILTALFLSATATAATVTQEGSGIGKDGEIKVKVVFGCPQESVSLIVRFFQREIRHCAVFKIVHRILQYQKSLE